MNLPKEHVIGAPKRPIRCSNSRNDECGRRYGYGGRKSCSFRKVHRTGDAVERPMAGVLIAKINSGIRSPKAVDILRSQHNDSHTPSGGRRGRATQRIGSRSAGEPVQVQVGIAGVVCAPRIPHRRIERNINARVASDTLRPIKSSVFEEP